MSGRGILTILSGEARSPVAWGCRIVLWLLSLFYGIAARLKNLAFDTGIRRPTRVTRPDGTPLPIICIGNLTAGGTGKTPMVELVVRELQATGHTPGILSRGYGAKDDANGSANDEARMLAESLPGVPHVQNPDRIAGARALSRLNVDVIVMDDGFSHRRLARDLDILLFDATNPFGYGHLLPRGLLREPLSAARRSQMSVITRSDAVTSDELRTLSRRLVSLGVSPERILTASHVPVAAYPLSQGAARADSDLSSLQGLPVFALCGIGNPAAFHKTLQSLGANVMGSHDLPDHFAYPDQWLAADFPAIQARAKSLGARAIAVTHKDAVKLRNRIRASDPHILELRVGMKLDPQGHQSLSRILESAFVTHS